MIWIITSIVVFIAATFLFFIIRNDFKKIQQDEKELDEIIKKIKDNIP